MGKKPCLAQDFLLGEGRRRIVKFGLFGGYCPGAKTKVTCLAAPPLGGTTAKFTSSPALCSITSSTGVTSPSNNWQSKPVIILLGTMPALAAGLSFATSVTSTPLCSLN